MTCNRKTARVGQDVRLGILFRWDGTPTDPLRVHFAEIIGPDEPGPGSIAMFTEVEHVPGSGEYYVTVPGLLLKLAGRYLDRWSYIWVEGEDVQRGTQDFYVKPVPVKESDK